MSTLYPPSGIQKISSVTTHHTKLRLEDDLDSIPYYILIPDCPCPTGGVGGSGEPITISGPYDYITLSGQNIVRDCIDLSTDACGNLPTARLNNGSGASSSTFWRGDGVWSPASGVTNDASGINYDDSSTSLGGDVQTAIDNLYVTVTGCCDHEHWAYEINYSGDTTGLGDDVQEAIDNLYLSIGSGTEYILPTGSTTVLGGVRIDGSTITIDSSGVISASGTDYILPTGSTTTLGGVRVDGSTITIDSSGVISVTGCCDADEISYSGDTTGLGDNVQEAIDNLYLSIGSGDSSDWVAATQLQVDINETGNLVMTPSKFRFHRQPSNGAYVITDLTGNTRGPSSLDIQSLRSANTQVTSGDTSSAFGAYNTVNTRESAAIGYSNSAFPNRTLANLTVVGSWNQASGSYSSAFGYGNKTLGQYSVTAGSNNEIRAQNSTAVGVFNNIPTNAYVYRASCFGYQNSAEGNSTTAVGYRNTASSQYKGSAVGYMNQAIGNESSSFGIYNEATGVFSSAFGAKNITYGFRSSAFGYDNQAWDLQCTAVGYSTRAQAEKSSAFGHYARTLVANTAEIGYWRQWNQRGGSIRMHESGMVAFTVQNRSGVYNDGGATVGSEPQNSLPRNMFAIRRDGLEFILDYNDSGTVKSLSLGTVS
jgi:hypothetical protein